MRVLPLGVLAFRGGCPVTEAYLAYLRLGGMMPALIFAIDYIGESMRARQLGQRLGTRPAAYLLRLKRNRAARVPARLAEAVQQGLPIRLTPGRELQYARAAQRVVHLSIENYADPRLLAALRASGVRTFLYCSGGRVPVEFFRGGLCILHVHPGVVPQVRGSDGLLWSLQTRGRPGATCFYMDAGIDTGRVIATAEYEPPRWPGLKASPQSLYHALLHCYDPHLRAALLVSVLEKATSGEDLANLECAAQSHTSGGHYFTMHPRLRERVLARLCK